MRNPPQTPNTQIEIVGLPPGTSIPIGSDGKPDLDALRQLLGLPPGSPLPAGLEGLNLGNANVQIISGGAPDANMLKKMLGLPNNWTPPPGFDPQTFRIPLGYDGKPDVQALINTLGLPSTHRLPPGFDMNNIGVDYSVSSNGIPVQEGQEFMTYPGGQGESGGNSVT
ncbi:UNVERIFIED_CONTAM: hypothetical protein RMT77_013575 [Armadillidium vulgare]